MKLFKHQLKNSLGQTTIEYVLFIIVMFFASYGMVKLFTIAWKYKFEFVSSFVGIVSVLL